MMHNVKLKPLERQKDM